MQKFLFLTLFLFLHTFLFAQRINKYWIELTDKNNSPYCTCRPAEFLSARALDRRAKANIEVVENDLPVNPDYLRQLQIKGVQIHNTSKWLNAVTVMADSAAATQLVKLPFVKSIEYIGPHLKFRNPHNRPQKGRAPLPIAPKIEGKDIPVWGYTFQQNQMLGLPILHLAGHRGAGIWIAVMDGGFTNADTIPLFDSVALQGRLHPGWDFVERDESLFEAANHGTSVLSVMASNLPGYFIGAAPDATYFLIKTEDTGGEFPVEEANWIAGAEWADSIGVDLINASLGYTSFNENFLSHKYAELNGHTAIGSRGASIAATKGMIICNAAGNEGDGSWHYIGVPADAPGIVSVGASGSRGERAEFSSWGPTSDGRIKPDLVAPGDQVVVAGNLGISLGLSSGTSLASPMLTGALASLWSACPEKTAKEILDAVYAGADQATAPDNARGYGLPEMTQTWLDLEGYMEGNGSAFKYDRLKGEMEFIFSRSAFSPIDRVEIRDLMGGVVHLSPAFTLSSSDISTLSIKGLGALHPGNYQVLLENKMGVKRLLGVVWK